MKKLIAAYLRVSTDDQKTDLQKEAIINYCKMKGIPADSLTWLIDQGESGSKTSRPAFDKMMEEARRGNLKAVITWKFDRIGRSTVHLIQVLEELKTLNIDFISITESVDTSNPMGKMIFGIFAVLAQFEREQLIMRTKAGMDAARSRGVRIGRASIFTEEEKNQLRDLAFKGWKIDEIRKKIPAFKRFSRASLYRALKEQKAIA